MSRGRVFNTKAAAEYCGIAQQTVRNKLVMGEFPEPHKQGRINGWFQDELDAFLKAALPDYDEVHEVAA
ncbi:helix-turn-helix transcriptional regulator [Microbacterium sp. NPDC056052]|uniref:helix-turn-helix transcriptional regulator n=1 Tax=Microbacterium sp. NPDC056052 TaxID=3345695 RepID=UPI0035D8C79A